VRTQQELEEKLEWLEASALLRAPSTNSIINASLCSLRLEIQAAVAALKWALNAEVQK